MQAIKKKKSTIGRTMFIILGLSIPVANFLVFWVYVNFNSILMAFQLPNKTTFTMENFNTFFKEFGLAGSQMQTALSNTLIFFFFNLLIVLPSAFLMSYFLFKKIFLFKYYRIMFFMPSIISAVVLTTVFKYMIGSSGGIFPALYKMFFNSEAPKLLYTDATALSTILFYCLWTGSSVNIVLFNGAMTRVPIEVLESAKIDGADMKCELFKIIVPMIWPTLSTLLTFTLVGLFTASGPILLLTDGANKTSTIAFWIFDNVRRSAAPNYPSAVGLVFTLVGLPIVLTGKYFMGKVWADVEY